LELVFSSRVLNSSTEFNIGVFILKDRRKEREGRNAQVAGEALSGVHYVKCG
jgi:hypothetical protein